MKSGIVTTFYYSVICPVVVVINISIFACKPEGQEGQKELEVYNFTGAGGVALSMYNTDEVYALYSEIFLFN